MRVKEDDVRHVLAWARNYGEIEFYELLPGRGRRWLLRLPAGVLVEGGEPGILSSPVPGELVLTSREALAFGFGCAAAGARATTRAAFAAKEWNW